MSHSDVLLVPSTQWEIGKKITWKRSWKKSEKKSQEKVTDKTLSILRLKDNTIHIDIF